MQVIATPMLTEFCCASSYTHFQVCKLRQHVEMIKDKLETIEEGNQRIHRIIKYLATVGRNLWSIDQEFRERKKIHQEPVP